MKLSLTIETFPIRGEFRIARGAKTKADVLVATLQHEGIVGRGEAVPYARYGETPESVLDADIEQVTDREALRRTMKAGARRNAIDLALADLDARSRGTHSPREEIVRSALTLSLDAPEAMALAASRSPGTLLKLKLAGDAHDADRLRAVHDARPDAELWLDANEGLDRERYLALIPLFESLPIVLLEQPFAASNDAMLVDLPRPIPICADESARDAATLDALADRYDAINVKLDKTGGLLEARDVALRARALGLDVVIGCMVSTSLALAPAFVLATEADFVDLDGALFLERDRDGGIELLSDGTIRAPSRDLWAG